MEAKNALQAYAYELASTVRNEKVAARIGSENVDSVREMVADTIDWLDDHPNADEEVYVNKRHDIKTAALPLLGIQRRAEVDGASDETPTTEKAAFSAAPGGGKCLELAWRPGPNGCIVEPVD